MKNKKGILIGIGVGLGVIAAIGTAIVFLKRYIDKSLACLTLSDGDDLFAGLEDDMSDYVSCDWAAEET